MAVPSRSLLQLIEAVAENLAALEQGTATGGSTTTVVAAAYPFLSSRTNLSSKLYEGCEIYPTSGTYSGQAREIVTYAPATGTFTASLAWGGAIANAVTFDIFKKGLRHDEIKAAVNKALRHRKYLDVAALTISNTELYRYALPDTITSPNEIVAVIDDDEFTDTVQHFWWDVVPSQATDATVPFEVVVNPTPGNTAIYLLYTARYAELANDANTTTMPRDWAETAATVELLKQVKNRGAGQDTTEWKALYREKLAELNTLDQRYMNFASFRMGFASPPYTPSSWSM